MQIACTVSPFVACQGLPYFPDYPINQVISEKVIEHKMWFNFLHNFYLKHFSL